MSAHENALGAIARRTPNPHGQNGVAWVVGADPRLVLSTEDAGGFVKFALSKFEYPALAVFMLDPAQANALALAVGGSLPAGVCRLVANHADPIMRACNVRLLATSLWAIGYDVKPWFFLPHGASMSDDPFGLYDCSLRLPGEVFRLG